MFDNWNVLKFREIVYVISNYTWQTIGFGEIINIFIIIIMENVVNTCLNLISIVFVRFDDSESRKCGS